MSGLFAFSALACFAGAFVCLVASIGGYFGYRDWHWPGWTVGGTFGIEPALFGPDMIAAQNFDSEIEPLNAGRGFTILGSDPMLTASIVAVMKPPKSRRTRS